MTTYKEWIKKGSLENFWNGVHLEDEEREDSKLVDTGGYNKNKRERERERSWQLGVGQQGGMEKECKTVTLDRERCENIKTIYKI